jgi:hypothetical protein
MPGVPIPSRPTHSFPKGKPIALILVELLYLVLVVGWFFYWAFYHGFTRWRDWLPFVFIVVGYAILYSRMLVFYERKGRAVRITRMPTEHNK